MQASRSWEPPTGTLGEILAATRARIAGHASGATTRRRGGAPSEAEPLRPRTGDTPSLAQALRQPNVAVIAEIKRRSPSRGDLDVDLHAGEQASRFERGGAAAISVLTESARFGGSLEDLRAAAAATRLPLLKKDFHISPEQLPDALFGQASAILLIARALPPRDLSGMMRMAAEMALECLVEVRTQEELEAALEGGARMVGVNARDLETLAVDESVPERLLPQIPADVVAVWESGIASRADVQRAADAGADAVLVGSALSLADDPAALLGTLTTIPRRPRD